MDGTNISNKQIASTSYDNYKKMLSAGTLNLNVKEDNVNVGDAVTIKIVVEYYKTDATEVSNDNYEVNTVFK